MGIFSSQDLARELEIGLLYEGSIRRYDCGYRANMSLVWMETGLTLRGKGLETNWRDRE